jgi:pimeloyl-ACP methyl ester carboxylesterase
MFRWMPIAAGLVCGLAFAACKTQAPKRVESRVQHVPSADGVEIHYRVAGADLAEPTIVFVHGLGCDSTIFDAAMAHVSQRWRAVAIDLPGHGQSGSNRRNWTMEAFGDDVRRVCDAVAAQQIVLVGHSMGGPVILEAAHEMPDRVLALIPVETFHEAEAKPTEAQVDRIVDAWRQDFKGTAEAMVRGSLHQPIRDPALAQALSAKLVAMKPEIVVTLLEAMFHYDVAAGLEDLTLPIRCINSEHRPTNLAAGRRHAKRFDARAMPGVGHYPMLEDPEAFAALLDAAMDELVR